MIFASVAIVTAPVLLLIHVWWNPRSYWCFYFPVAILAIWVGGSASTYFCHGHLWEEMHKYEARGEEPPRALADDWASDVSVAIMPLFGWIPGIVYSCVFLFARTLFRSIRSLFGHNRQIRRGGSS